MTLIRNTAEGGTAGTVVTTSNSGGASGTALSAVTANVVRFETAAAKHGTMGYGFTVADGASGYAQLSNGQADSTSWAAQVYVRWPSAPSATHRFLALVSSGGAQVVYLQASTTGTIEVGGTTGFYGSATGTVKFDGTWYRVAVKGTSATSGTLDVEVYESDTSTRAVYRSFARDTGAAGVTGVRVGKLVTTPSVPAFQADSLAVDPGATTWISPEVATCTVTPNAGIDIVAQPGQSVGLVARGFDTATNRYVKTGTWSQVSGPPVALAPQTSTDGVSCVLFIAPVTTAGGAVVLRLTQTDGQGLTATDDVTVTVPPGQTRTYTGAAWT